MKTILVDVIDPQIPKIEAEKRLEELESLVSTYGGITKTTIIQKRSLPDYESYIGKGKVQEIFSQAKEEGIELIIINNILKPRQIYSLVEKFETIDVEVWDRIDLILKIFSRHAQSKEAKLQIELAGIRHMGPRIFGMGQDLMQQTGATGLRGGSGETNIEMMKRHLRKQELKILEKLKHYDDIHKGHRKRRQRQNFKTVALVGYTNAGKSSLMNALTKKGAYVADKLFATLDTRVGKLYLPPKSTPTQAQTPTPYKYIPGQEILISDTIGFIQDLPPDLIKAFKSTLAETIDSDLLLHVIDVSDPHIHMKIEVVEDILKQLGLEEKPKIYVFNKIDRIDHKDLVELKPQDQDELQKRGLLKAGRETAELLGWREIDLDLREKLEIAEATPELLKKRYKEFSPVFISAYEHLNLEKLTEQLQKEL